MLVVHKYCNTTSSNIKERITIIEEIWGSFA